MKIGITTHYYNSTNYGGNLQAYALCKKLNERFDAEQMCIDVTGQSDVARRRFKGGVLKLSIKVVKRVAKILRKKLHRKKYAFAQKQLAERKEAILRFGKEHILHSEKVYRPNAMFCANSSYDAFVTGSDQVWHPSAWNKAYRLDFAAKSKIKIS